MVPTESPSLWIRSAVAGDALEPQLALMPDRAPAVEPLLVGHVVQPDMADNLRQAHAFNSAPEGVPGLIDLMAKPSG